MRKVMFGGLLLAMVAGSLSAQQDGIRNRVSGALDSKFIDALCPLKGADFRTSSGKTYLKTGIEASIPENRARALNDGQRVITEAITTAGQDKSAPAWYYLARIYLQKGDLQGADSAFTRAQAIAPTCVTDIDKYRYKVWAALVNAGITFRQSKNTDSAFVMFRAANLIQRTNPLAYLSLGEMFNAANQNDSAAVYFARAADLETSDTAQTKNRNQAGFDLGVVYLQDQKYPEAVKAFQRYLAWEPKDVQAMKGLAAAFRGAGQVDSAKVVEAGMLGAAGSAGGGGEEGLTSGDLFDLGVKQFNDKDYHSAAATFGKVLEKEPNYHDALFNQANSYLALKDGPNLEKAAKRLLEMEPLSEYDLDMLRMGAQISKDAEVQVDAATRRAALPVNIEVQSFKTRADGASVAAKATGRAPIDLQGKALKVTETAITFEFLDASGAVVSSQDVTIPVLAAGTTQPVTAEGKGGGIKAWRYKVK